MVRAGSRGMRELSAWRDGEAGAGAGAGPAQGTVGSPLHEPRTSGQSANSRFTATAMK